VSAGRVAVVDIGSNSTRLFLCEEVGPAGPEGERLTTITGLRRGAAEDGTVTREALERLAECLTVYRGRIDAFGVGCPVIAVGTSAVRDAPNRDAIESVVADRLGAELRVLAGAHEAELSYVGARLAVDGDGPVIVIDIGGGSTELVRGDTAGPTSAVSLDVGAVRFTERFLHHDPPTGDEIAELRREVATMAVPALSALGGAAPMIGVAGTMTSLAAIAHGVYDPDRVHGAILAAAEVEEIAMHLASIPLDERRLVPGLHPERATSIVAGSLIASTVLAAAGADEIAVSERDLLDGAVLRLAASG
jgi:exopolyphosphatase/guanosine-5'-triphosphate,3'-diphosphate pyrophosphatase